MKWDYTEWKRKHRKKQKLDLRREIYIIFCLTVSIVFCICLGVWDYQDRWTPN